MASRFWVGGTGTWDQTGTSHWSSSNGGSGGASVPTSADDVFFTSSSGSGVITVSATRTCKSLTTTGYTGSMGVSGVIQVSGNVTIGSTTTWGAPGFSNIGPSFTIAANASCVFTTGGTIYPASITLSNGSTLTLGSDVDIGDNDIIWGTNSSSPATFDTAGFDLTCETFDGSNTSKAKIVNLNGSTITINEEWRWSGGSVSTLNAGTSLIAMTNSGTSTHSFDGGGATYYNVRFTGTGSGDFEITGSNTFNELEILPRASGTRELEFSAGTTQTVTTFDCVGTSGNPISLSSSSAGSPFFLSKASGEVVCDWLILQDCHATGGADWTPGENTVNNGNNSGWDFGFNKALMFSVF